MRGRNTFLVIAVWATWVVLTAGAGTILVKQDGTGDATTIQAALDAASNGDTIEVADNGRYVEDLTASPVLAQAGLAPALASFTLKASEGKKPVVEAANAETSQRMIVLGVGGRDMLGCVLWGCNGVTIQGIEFANLENAVNAFNTSSSLVIADSANITVENCTIRGPGERSPGDGSGILTAGVEAQPFRTDNITVRNCKVTECHYGVIFAVFQKGSGADPGQVTVEDCVFTNGFESAIDIDNAQNAVVRRCTFDNFNHGVHFAGGNSIVEDCLTMNSKAEGLEADIDENWNDQITGGVVRRCAFIGNGLDQRNPGIRCADGPIRIENCIIAGNGGVGLEVSASSTTDVIVTVDHCDFYQNLGDYEIHIAAPTRNDASLTITNTNIVSDGGGIFNEYVPEAVTAHHNNVFVPVDPYINVTPADSVSVDPMYVSPTMDSSQFTFKGFQLKPGSPVLAAGVGGTPIGSQGAQVTTVESWPVR